MLQIDDKIISLDIFEKKFICNLSKCKGACCVHGDSGAPLEDNETEILDSVFPIVKKHMRQVGVDAVESQGSSVIDNDGDKVTPLVNGMECAYVVFENGISKCAIEKTFELGEIYFQKPVSCHLYPIRIQKYKDFEAVNYHCWDICKPALQLGRKSDLPLYSFLAQPLIRKYGTPWYEKLKIAAGELEKMNLPDKNE